ncbi:MAG: hypothetical protein V4579_13495 [Pseudomonadota bacterium]
MAEPVETERRRLLGFADAPTIALDHCVPAEIAAERANVAANAALVGAECTGEVEDKGAAVLLVGGSGKAGGETLVIPVERGDAAQPVGDPMAEKRRECLGVASPCASEVGLNVCDKRRVRPDQAGVYAYAQQRRSVRPGSGKVSLAKHRTVRWWED